MIQRLSHATIFVTDQEVAREFYVDKLGFELNTDATMENGFRWLTVNPKGQPDLEIVLMKIDGGPFAPDVADLLRQLLAKGALGAGAFATADCRQTYEELKAKGVHFKSEPKEQFYGVEAMLQDPFGNWFSLTQPK